MGNRVYRLLFLAILCVGVSGEYNDNGIAKGFSARTMLEKIATALMSRAGTTSSQVLSLNLTNLLILVLLKALIFAAGSVGAAGWKGGHSQGRNAPEDEDGLISDTEMLLFLGYIAGTPGNHKCMQNVACHRPVMGYEYVKAGKALLKTVNTIPNLFGDYTEYKISLAELQEATDDGFRKINCDGKYQCSNNRVHITK